MKNHIVRIAPSPTGRLHIGTIRTAYHNWLIAQQTPNSELIVRIDDTDLERSQEDLIEPIFDSLSALGITFDRTFRQSEKFHIYPQYVQYFLLRGWAIEDDGCVRLNKDHNQIKKLTCDWYDTVTGEKLSTQQIDDFAKSQVIQKSDGSPTYNFASTVDDYESEVTWIVRGVDHISNTYKQVLIYKLLFIMDEEPIALPKFTHVGLVCHKTGKKLSKRDSDDIDLSDIDNDALLNYVLRLGWSPIQDNKANNIIDREKAIRLFLDEGNIKSSNAKIDLDKLAWYNKKYKAMARAASC